MRNKSLLWVSFAALMAFVPNAGATLQLTLTSGSTTIVVNDNGAGDVNTAAGQVTYVGAVGNWVLNVSTGTVGQNPLIDLNSVNTINGAGTGANSLTIEFSSTGYQNTLSTPLQFSSKIGGTLGSGSSLTYQGYVDSTDALYGMGSPIGALQTFGPGAISFSNSLVGGSVAPGATYSATEVVVLSGNGRFATSSFDAAIDAVPEPAAALLLGGVMLFTAGAIRRKKASGARSQQ